MKNVVCRILITEFSETIVQETAVQRSQTLDARIHELEHNITALSAAPPPMASSQLTNEAAALLPQSLPVAAETTLAPAASMEVNVSSPPRLASY